MASKCIRKKYLKIDTSGEPYVSSPIFDNYLTHLCSNSFLSSSTNRPRFHGISGLHVRIYDEKLAEHCNHSNRQEDIRQWINYLRGGVPYWRRLIFGRRWCRHYRRNIWLVWGSSGCHFVIVLLGIYCHSHPWGDVSRKVRRQAYTISWHSGNKCFHFTHSNFNNMGRFNDTHRKPHRHGSLPRLHLRFGFWPSFNMDSFERTNHSWRFCT